MHTNKQNISSEEKGFVTSIEKDALENTNFRKVIFTAKHSQLVLMSLKPGEEIGMETHEENDQFFHFEEGEGKVIIEDKEYEVEDDIAVMIPAGLKHNVINTSDEDDLKLYTIYSPAHHADGTVHATKEEAVQTEGSEEKSEEMEQGKKEEQNEGEEQGKIEPGEEAGEEKDKPISFNEKPGMSA